jgi:hypothetical protein
MGNEEKTVELYELCRSKAILTLNHVLEEVAYVSCGERGAIQRWKYVTASRALANVRDKIVPAVKEMEKLLSENNRNESRANVI